MGKRYTIGMIGLAGAGKDTVAEMLIKHLAVALGTLMADKLWSLTTDRYAAPLKQAARVLFGVNFDDRHIKETDFLLQPSDVHKATLQLAVEVLGHNVNRNTIRDAVDKHLIKPNQDDPISPVRLSPRLYQQKLGTEIFRDINPTIWCDRILKREIDPGWLDIVIVPDTRFPNEVGDINIAIHSKRVLSVPRDKLHVSEHFAYDITNPRNLAHSDIEPNILHVSNNADFESLDNKVQQLAAVIAYNLANQ